MGTHSTRGFTIIETMLFLAISGVLIIAMIGGVGVSINIQRYRDAVETFKTLLQDQYSALSSVENDRDNNWACNAQAKSEESGTEIRGQSDCVLLGRYVTIVDSDISIYSVLGREVAVPTTTGDDITKLKANYTLNISTVTDDTTIMEWGTRIAWPSTGTGSQNPTTPRSISLLFIRSPDSGQVYTFSGDTVLDEPTPQLLASFLVAGNVIPGQNERTICVDSNGLFVNATQSIYISAYATGPSSVESQSNDFVADPTSPRGDHTTQC